VSLSRQTVSTTDSVYADGVPKLWSETIEAHRHAIGEAILDATATLVAERGLASVTMSQIAQETGIGRATLYKYFADVDTILAAWHERHVSAHVRQLVEARDGAGAAWARLDAVLTAFARISRDQPRTDLAAALHRGAHVTRAEQHLRGLVRDLLVEAVAVGDVRADVEPDELVGYCLHALTAAGGLTSEAAVDRLVRVTMAGLRASH
jgi:AcrR family transcriptional regulator